MKPSHANTLQSAQSEESKYEDTESPTNLVGGGLSVIDLSDPANPRLAGSYNGGRSCGRVAVAAGYAYVLDHWGPEGLLVLDVREPANPREVGRFEINYPHDIALSGNIVYLTVGGRLYVLDVTDPANPRLVGASGALDEYIGDVAVVGDCVYVTGLWSGLHIFDRRPANPQSVGRVNVSGQVGVSKLGRAAVSGNYAYLADLGVGLHVIDIHAPPNPQVVGSYTNLPESGDVAVSGSYACVAAGHAGLEVIDVTDPARLRRVGGLSYPGDASCVETSGDFAFVLGWGEGLTVVDISTPSSPRRVGGFGPLNAMALAVSGDFAYVTDYEAGFHVINITNPANPHRIGGYQSLGHAREVTISDHFAFFTEEARHEGTNSLGGGLVIVDIADPSHPEEVGRYSSSLYLSSVAVAGAHAYITDDAGLQVLDIGNPTNPRRVGGNPLTDGAWSAVLVAGERLFSAGNGKLTIFDLHRPFRLESLPKPDSGPFRLRVDGPRGVTARLQRSNNVTEWEDWQPVTFGAAPTELSDPDAATAQCCLYRALIR